MKKLAIFVLTLSVIFSVLVSCNKTDAVETETPAAATQSYPEIINDVIEKHRDAYVKEPSVAYASEEKAQAPDLTFMAPEKMADLSNAELEVLREDYNAFKKYMYMTVYSALDEMYPDAPAVELGVPEYVNFGRAMFYKFLEADKCAGATEEEIQEYLNGTVFPIVCNYPADVKAPEKDLGDVYVVTSFLYISYYDSETGTSEDLPLFDGEDVTRAIFDNTASDEVYALLEEYLGKEFVDSMKAEAEAVKEAAKAK